MKTALFPGSFDPFTIGHADIVARGLKIFDRVIIAIGENCNKTPFQNLADRHRTVKTLYSSNPRVEVVTYHGLTADLAAKCQADAILRSVRSLKDYEYERDMADINQQLNGTETVLLFCRPELAAVSSSTVRELHSFGKDITPFLPYKQD
ncbi:MAG: pantetheine-phosphate adenylyltransferase [Bacteroidaceae bacterium]|nr:pantetheine-phosphate adenylyltransferase [Prevotellaceae bacterium]MDY2849850.1 pantetheine-phosphate adenylyltransferase [Bacteroidaceae bacterium]